MDDFKHPLFFEAKDLRDKEKHKVRRHFQKRRESGGGDCGMIEKAGGNTYKICFKEIEDQERVLQRKIHNISLPSGDLCLNVSRSYCPETPDQPSTSQPKTTSKVNTKGPEKIFKLDIFLMYFLRDNPKAYKLFQKQLSCIGCQVELHFEEEEAVVRGDIEKGPGGAFGAAEQWELQVDQVLIDFTERYLCYHVVEPKKAKILLQDLSFVTDDVKVYREGGYPVVVGETEAVHEKIAIIDIFLGMIGMKQNKVTLKASLSPYPCVLVSGPCHLVKEAKQGLISALASLTSDTLVLDGPGALQYFQAEGKAGKELVESSFQVIVKEQQGEHSANVQSKPRSISSPLTSGLAPRPLPRLRCNTVGGNVAIKTSLEIKLGCVIDAQANVLVVPMLNKNLTSTKIGNSLFQKAGNAIKSKFDSVAANCWVAPGDVLQVDAPPSLGCSKLFFIECLPWDGVRGQSVKALGNGLKRCLDLCVQQFYSTVAFPVIGPGVVLKYPMKEAIQVLMENICQLGLSASSGSLTTIQIVIKPGYPDSEECYQDVYRHPGLNVNQGGEAIFRSITSDLDEITMTVGGGVKLHLVFGDITDETTDAVVNTTDFVDFQIGVCKDILTVAGADVEAELKAAKSTRGDVFVSKSGKFPCKALFHVCGQKDAVVIEQLVIRIVDQCVSLGFKSVAIPAISAGAGGLDPGVVARAILRGVKDATSSFGLNALTDIRLVLLKINVFLAFKEKAMQMFSTAVINKVSVPQLPRVEQQQQPPSVEADLSIICNSSTSQQSVFRFLGLSRKDVDGAKTKLTDLYQAQCSSQTFRKEELKDLTQDDVKDLKQLVETEGLYVELSQGTLTVSGLKDGVIKVMQMINASLHGNLRREVRVMEEEDLYAHVAWCILGHRGNWERLPKTANHSLENNDEGGRIVDAQGDKWTMDLPRMEATKCLGGQTAKLKRLEHLSDFTLPLYWDNMAASEALKTVELLPSCAEYRTVKEAFRRTVGKTVLKIERLQNVHLRRAYEAKKKQISEKYKQRGGECEKLLYHGTTQHNFESIVKTGFNRSFSGKNATNYGEGTYFAVNASYSAQPTYSQPAADGSQLMFVARVLTGIYTQGQQNMRVPPPISNQGDHDRYDSVVDGMDNPQMYVVFHDNQAYPDYLITFKQSPASGRVPAKRRVTRKKFSCLGT